ncbi:MAG: SsrA-binding protein SmpB [Myxococcales bacterium]|nr:SsrA-binding protein SmpB [Myxococcales bacterium]
MSKKKPTDANVVANNRRAGHDYEITEEFEAGIQLQGTEVKSLREGRATINEAYVTVKDGEAWLMNANIPEYAFGNRENHEPKRPRKLLLKRAELERIARKLEAEGFTGVPMRIYFLRGWAKLRFGLGRGRKHYDKRQNERTKQDRREIRQAMRDY